jgi:hypothetical protein
MPIKRITTEAQIPSIGVGVYVNRTAPMNVARGRGDLVVGIIGVAPWGPPEAWTTPTSDKDFIETFAPFGWGGDNLREMFGLPWGRFRFWNVRGTSPGAATRTFDDASAGDSLTITARRTGSSGNRILITITANGTTATSRDVRVYVLDPSGSVMWDETHLAVQTSDGSVTDPGDPWVTMAEASGATGPAAAISAAALSGGTEGTVAAANYREAMDAAGVDAGVDILVCVGVNSSTVADLRESMTTWAASSVAQDIACAIMPTPTAQAVSASITDVASHRHRKLRACYPLVQRSYTYSFRGYSRTATETMDGAAVLACLIQRAGPTHSIFQAQAREDSYDALSAILDLETGYGGISSDSFDDLMAAGVIGWYKSRALGNLYVPYSGVTTYLDASSNPARDLDERFFHYVSQAIAEFLERVSGKPLDVNLADRILGPTTNAAYNGIVNFLQGLKSQGLIIEGLNSNGTTSPAFTVDPFTGASAERLAAGRWDIGVAYRQVGAIERVVIRFNAGTGVDITRV